MSDLLDHIILDQSYRNFHSKGLDYLCLKRSAEHTIKVYFFDGDADLSSLPEIVMPHDHRYHFDTVCIAGEVSNLVRTRTSDDRGERFEQFAWDTPLLGGTGFSHVGEVFLSEADVHNHAAGARWHSKAHEIHTLRIDRAGSIIRLDQYADVVPIGTATSAYRKADVRGDISIPELAGLYETMVGDYAIRRYMQYLEASR